MLASILSIGDELLVGQTINTNAAWLSQQLTAKGITVSLQLSVADTVQAIHHGLDILSAQSEIILVTGGLGPTVDDITKTAIISYFDDKLAFDSATYSRIEDIMSAHGLKPSESHKRQAHLPSKAILFPNPLGTAPGMLLNRLGIAYYFMPGVPFEMQALFTNAIWPDIILRRDWSPNILTRTICTAGIGETVIEDKIAHITNEFDKDVQIAYLPDKGLVRLRLTGSAESADRLDQYQLAIANVLGSAVFGYQDDTLLTPIATMLKAHNWTIGLAESCTGGAISTKITSQPGASLYFHGSIISYDNRIKRALLDVSPQTIETYGAVSAECVHEMVAGALKALGVDWAIGISGIAGPTGGSEEKPVGTVYIGVGHGNQIKVKRFRASKSREVNIDYFVHFALNFLRLELMKSQS